MQLYLFLGLDSRYSRTLEVPSQQSTEHRGSVCQLLFGAESLLDNSSSFGISNSFVNKPLPMRFIAITKEGEIAALDFDLFQVRIRNQTIKSSTVLREQWRDSSFHRIAVTNSLDLELISISIEESLQRSTVEMLRTLLSSPHAVVPGQMVSARNNLHSNTQMGIDQSILKRPQNNCRHIWHLL